MKSKRTFVNLEPKEHKKLKQDAKNMRMSISGFLIHLWYQWRQKEGKDDYYNAK